MVKVAHKIRECIEADLGFFPPFFEPALDDAATLESLWHQTLSAYAAVSMPNALQERVAISVSRYCRAPHRLLAYVATTRKMQMSATELLASLQGLPKSQESFYPDEACIMALGTSCFGWPQAESEQEKALIRCATALFTHPKPGNATTALRRFLTPSRFLRLNSFIAYLRAGLSWAEGFPEISYESDSAVACRVDALIKVQPRLLPYFMPPLSPSTAALDMPVLDLLETESDADRSAEHFECAKSAMNLGVWSSLAPFDEVTWNQRIRELFFVDSNETITSDTFFGRLHPEDCERVRDAVDRSLHGRVMFDAKMRAVNPKDVSQIRWIHSLAWVSYDVSNRPIRLDGIAIDLAVSEKLDRSTNARDEQLRNLLDALPSMAWLDDGKAERRWMNKCWYTYTGLSASNDTLESIHPYDRQRLMEHREGKDTHSGPKTIFYRLLGAHGRYRWVKDQGTPYTDPAGTCLGTVGSIVDIGAVSGRERQTTVWEDGKSGWRPTSSQTVVQQVTGRVAGLHKKTSDATKRGSNGHRMSRPT